MDIDTAINRLLDRIEALETDIINISTKLVELESALDTEVQTTNKVPNLKDLVDMGISVEDSRVIGVE